MTDGQAVLGDRITHRPPYGRTNNSPTAMATISVQLANPIGTRRLGAQRLAEYQHWISARCTVSTVRRQSFVVAICG